MKLTISKVTGLKGINIDMSDVHLEWFRMILIIGYIYYNFLKRAVLF